MPDLNTIGELLTALGVVITLVLLPSELLAAWKEGRAESKDQNLTGWKRHWHPIRNALRAGCLCICEVPVMATVLGVVYFLTPHEWHLTPIVFVLIVIVLVRESWSARIAREKALQDAEDRVMKAEDRVNDAETRVLDAEIRVMEVEDRLMQVEDRIAEADDRVREAEDKVLKAAAEIEKQIEDFQAQMDRRTMDSLDEDL